MATRKQKKELIDALKFTPQTVRFMIQGYGGESYAGRVDRSTYEFFKSQKIHIEQYANAWDDALFDDVPAEHRPFQPGSPYDCDDLWHASGAELSSSNEITVNDEQGNTIWSCSCESDDLSDTGVTVSETGGCDLADLQDGTVVFWGGQGEKGCFFDAEFTLRAPFDAAKLTVMYENCDGWYIITGAEYDGEELDGHGGYSTTGKWTEHKWIITGDEPVYQGQERDEDGNDDDEEDQDDVESSEDIEVPVLEGEETWAQRVIDESGLSAWHDHDVEPVRKGVYEVEYESGSWPWPITAKVKWTGRRWKHDRSENTEIRRWRGLNYDPGR
jgi:hypothetical protein